MTNDDVRSYWSIDIPGLTSDQAQEIISWLGETRPSLHGIPVDPGKFMTLHVDREGVDIIRRALVTLPSSDITQGLVSVIDEWLAEVDKNSSA